jgi:murein DD-endopeptidase MepM/ murein hydrolase activator NlpD
VKPTSWVNLCVHAEGWLNSVLHKTRTVIAVLAVVAATFVGVAASEAQVSTPPLPPVATTPTEPPGPLPTPPPRATSSTVAEPPTTQPAPPPTSAPAPAPAPPPPDPAPTAPPPSTGIQPAPVTGILPGPAPSGGAPKTEIIANGGGSSTTVAPGQQPAAADGTGASSLNPDQVDEILRGLQRSGANSTAALLDALRPLQDLGMTADEAAALGMAQFPVQGRAEWTDDWLAPRTGPPFHLHQGNDLFAAFDTPVRSPVDGTVRFGSDPLGGNAAYVTAPDGTYYYMAHLKGYATDLSSGQQVAQGRVVGYVGDSGNAKGGAPHVHFEIHPGGGAAVNPKPIVDGWVAAAVAKVPELLARFRPASVDAAEADDAGIPQVLVATGLTRRFSTPTRPAAPPEPPAEAWARAVLTPVTPQALSPLLDRTTAS